MPEATHLPHMLRRLPAGVATLLGPELRVGFANGALENLLGTPVAPDQPLAAQPGPVPPDLVEVMQQVYRSGRPFVARAYGLPSSTADAGTVLRYYDLTLEPVGEDDQTASGLLLFAVDVTEQEQARRRAHELAIETRRLDTRLRVLTETVPQITFTVDAEGHYEYVSPQWYYFTGQPTTADLNAIWPLLIHPDDRLRVSYQAEAARAAGTGWSYEYRLRRHDGRYRWHLLRARQLTDERGPRWFGACTDVDDQHRLREVLQTQYDELARTNRDLDTFVYTASHDLKQPLLNLRGLFDELRRTACFYDPDEACILTMVEGVLTQLDDILQELAATVQDQRGLASPAEALDLRTITEEVLLGLRPQVQESGATIELDFAAPELTYGRANLRSILHNLLSNALKFAHPDRTPRIVVRSALPAPGRPTLTVQDNGLGMHVPERAGPLFQPFERQHPHIGGAGVGMYLVQRVVAACGGRLEVESHLGEGTSFTIHWFDE